MDRKEYFRNLISLYEATQLDAYGEQNAPVSQSEIADSGSDLMQQQQQPMQPAEDEMQQMGYEDPNQAMMGDPSMQMPQPAISQEEQSSLVLEKQKFVKLYTLFDSLLDYGVTFYETLDTIDQNLIPIDKLNNVNTYKENLNSLNEKINDYMINIFDKEAYEKVLYSYIVFRTELIANIKGLRDTLELNNPDEPFPENIEKLKNSRKK